MSSKKNFIQTWHLYAVMFVICFKWADTTAAPPGRTVTGEGPCVKDALPCFNGGTCFEEHGEKRCRCAPSFGGTHCEEQIIIEDEPCIEGLPCLNGGTCFEEHGKKRCRCPADHEGTRCENFLGGGSGGPSPQEPAVSKRPDPKHLNTGNETESVNTTEYYNTSLVPGSRKRGRLKKESYPTKYPFFLTSPRGLTTPKMSRNKLIRITPKPVGSLANAKYHDWTWIVVCVSIVILLFSVGFLIYCCRRHREARDRGEPAPGDNELTEPFTHENGPHNEVPT